MFTKDELNYLFSCVETRMVSNTQEARNKAAMMLKLCELLDLPDKPAEPAEDKPKAAPRKKATRKKK